nr:hypothetical protein Iba_chr11bCG18030 [Ipomoea batatas]
MSALAPENTSIKGLPSPWTSHAKTPHFAACSAVYLSELFALPVPTDNIKNRWHPIGSFDEVDDNIMFGEVKEICIYIAGGENCGLEGLDIKGRDDNVSQRFAQPGFSELVLEDLVYCKKECISYLKLLFKVSNNGAGDDATDASSINAKDGDNAAGRDGRSVVLSGGGSGGRRGCLAVSHFKGYLV